MPALPAPAAYRSPDVLVAAVLTVFFSAAPVCAVLWRAVLVARVGTFSVLVVLGGSLWIVRTILYLRRLILFSFAFPSLLLRRPIACLALVWCLIRVLGRRRFDGAGVVSQDCRTR